MSSPSPRRTPIPTLADATRRREPPATQRGARTRASLVEAARRVFERDGYVDARLADITVEAGCSTGTFYTYFDSKDEVFNAVLEAVEDDMLHPGMERIEGEQASAYDVLEASNRAYLTAYRRNARLMLLLEEVAAVDPTFRAARLRRSRAFIGRNARAIRRLQEEGLADPGIDPDVAARALSSMVSRLAYYTFCLGERASLESLVQTSTTLWANALRLER